MKKIIRGIIWVAIAILMAKIGFQLFYYILWVADATTVKFINWRWDLTLYDGTTVLIPLKHVWMQLGIPMIQSVTLAVIDSIISGWNKKEGVSA